METMTIDLYRKVKRDTYTIGELAIDGVHICDTLEDTDRGLTDAMMEAEIIRQKVYGQTAIPTGIYHIAMDTVSTKFKNKVWARPHRGVVPRLLSVKGFEGVLIHPGNTVADTLGCILVGVNDAAGRVSQSVSTYSKLMDLLMTAHNEGRQILINIH